MHFITKGDMKEFESDVALVIEENRNINLDTALLYYFFAISQGNKIKLWAFGSIIRQLICSPTTSDEEIETALASLEVKLKDEKYQNFHPYIDIMREGIANLTEIRRMQMKQTIPLKPAI